MWCGNTDPVSYLRMKELGNCCRGGELSEWPGAEAGDRHSECSGPAGAKAETQESFFIHKFTRSIWLIKLNLGEVIKISSRKSEG